MRRTGRLAALVLATLVAASIAAAAPAFGSPAPARSATTAAQVRADVDGNGLFDDLERRLGSKSAADKVDVIVQLRDAASAERVRGLERAVGSFVTKRRFSIVPAFAARASKRQVEALARDPRVAHVEEDSIASKANDAAQDAFGAAKARIDAPGLDGNADGNVASYSTADLVAAVIDTGIAGTHIDLDEGKVLAFRDFVNNQPTAYDDDGHGTHVAATLAGEGDARGDRLYEGVAPGAGLVGVKVLDGDGNGSVSNIIAGIDWVVANRALYGIEAINMSLRIEGCSNGTDSTSTAVNNAKAAGLVVVVAAGNEGPGTCTIGSPSAATGALTVGAMADFGSDGFTQAFFSSRGPTQDGRIKPDVSAPGVAITSAQAGTFFGYANLDGSSMATPFVSGVTLLMLDQAPALTPQQLKDKIMQTAIDWARGGNNQTTGTSGADIDYGAGRLDAYAAIQSAGAPISTPPLPPAHELRQGTLAGAGAQVDFALDVTDTSFPIGATLIIPAITGGTSNSLDFDLYLFDPTGAQVAASEFTTRQEELGFKPLVLGTYTLRVKSFRGSGGFFVDVSLPKGSLYPRPGGGTPLRVPLVPVFTACTSANSSHVGPLAQPSCTPAAQQSPLLTTSTTGRGQAAARLDVLSGNSTTAADEADLRIAASATDVRRSSDGSDYVGKTILTTTIRITDRGNGFFSNEAGTVQDLAFGIPLDCAATPDPALGSSCNLNTTADTLVPGFAREGKRATVSTFSLQLNDAGPDAGVGSPAACPPSCGTGDEQAFLRQGVFTP